MKRHHVSLLVAIISIATSAGAAQHEAPQTGGTAMASAPEPALVSAGAGSKTQGGKVEPKQRRIIEGVELQGLAPAAFAAVQGISSGNAAVRLYRARRMMTERLKGICGTCSLDACSDCDCGHQQGPTL